jgi:putative phosphoesterase
MRIITVSDLHLQSDQIEIAVNELSFQADKAHASMILIGGDISNDVYVTLEFVLQLNRKTLTYYVPGNHDLWNKCNGLSTQDIWSMYDNDPNCLLGRSVVLTNHSTLIGHVGWYDYSFADTKFTTKQLELKELDGTVWQDREFVHFDSSDQVICRDHNSQLARLMEVATQDSPRFVVLMTHMVSHEAFTVKHNTSRNWGYFNGFLGSKALVEIATKADLVICGHVHYRKNLREGKTTYLCRCLGYPSEWQYYSDSTHFADQLELACGNFEVPE